MVKQYLIRVPLDVITRGDPEERERSPAPVRHMLAMDENYPWRSTMFSELSTNSKAKQSRMGAQPERVATWKEATKTWDRKWQSERNFHNVTRWAAATLSPEDLESEALLCFDVGSGPSKTVHYK